MSTASTTPSCAAAARCGPRNGSGVPSSRPPTGGRTRRPRGGPFWSSCSGSCHKTPRPSSPPTSTRPIRRPSRAFRIGRSTIARRHRGQPHAAQPALPSQPGGSPAAPRQRQPQAGDDRLLEAAAGRALPGGDLGGVAQLHEVAIGEPSRRAAGGPARADPRPAPHAGGPRREALPLAPAARCLARALLLRADPDAKPRPLPDAHAQLRGLSGSPRRAIAFLAVDPFFDPQLKPSGAGSALRGGGSAERARPRAAHR